MPVSPVTQSPSDRPDKQISVGLMTLGCAKNLVDTEHMTAQLLGSGFNLAGTLEDADVILVNTCGFIDDAKEESIQAALEACELKKGKRRRGVIVAGCLVQRYREELREGLPEVDAFVGLDEIGYIAAIVRQVAAGERNIFRVPRDSRALFEPGEMRVVLTGGPYAYLKIAEGCSHGCTFCAIPSIRGRYRSRGIPGIVAEADRLVGHNMKELNLIAQDTTEYGKDLKDGTDLVSLLQAVDELEGEYWIRLLYGYPAHVTSDLLEAIGRSKHMCRYLDIPIQHSHAEILRAMGRQNSDAVLTLPDRAREILPDVTLRTTCLVGFPGETEKHFEHLMSFLAEARFDHVGVFAFSPQEGTPARKLPGRVAAEVAEERRDRLMKAQQERVMRARAKLAGTREEILVERFERGICVGRSQRCAPEVDGEVMLHELRGEEDVGRFVTATYTAVDGYDMIAEVKDSPESA